MIIKINPQTDDSSAGLSLDLKAYFHAYDNKENNPNEYVKQYGELKACFSAIEGVLLWEELLIESLNAFSTEKIDMIRHSPAVFFMKQSFIEIVKNCVDERILSYDPDIETCLKLELMLTIEIKENHVMVRLMDNGRGFSTDFLTRTVDQDARAFYLKQAGSPKYGIEEKPDLLGGAGRALRVLIAQVEHGAELLNSGYFVPKYIIPELSTISFANQTTTGHTGAIITVTTSVAPLGLLSSAEKQRSAGDEESQDEIELTDIISHSGKRKLRP